MAWVGLPYKSATRTTYYQDVVADVAFLVLGVWCAYEAESVPAMIALGMWLVRYLWRTLPYETKLRETYEVSAYQCKKREIELEITERGLLERDQEVESFAPWSAAVSFAQWESMVFIELSSGQSAVIDIQTLASGPGGIEGLLGSLREHGVADVSVEVAG